MPGALKRTKNATIAFGVFKRIRIILRDFPTLGALERKGRGRKNGIAIATGVFPIIRIATALISNVVITYNSVHCVVMAINTNRRATRLFRIKVAKLSAGRYVDVFVYVVNDALANVAIRTHWPINNCVKVKCQGKYIDLLTSTPSQTMDSRIWPTWLHYDTMCPVHLFTTSKRGRAIFAKIFISPDHLKAFSKETVWLFPACCLSCDALNTAAEQRDER